MEYAQHTKERPKLIKLVNDKINNTQEDEEGYIRNIGYDQLNVKN